MPTHFEVPLYLDYLAVFTWALSGAILGVSKGYDITGVFIVALLSSVGGSMLRDGIFLNQPPPVVTNPYYLPLILLVYWSFYVLPMIVDIQLSPFATGLVAGSWMPYSVSAHGSVIPASSSRASAAWPVSSASRL